MANATALGWNYQSFGVWTRDLSPTSWTAGATSAGSVTPFSAIPTINSAIFNGSALGLYVDASGTPFATTASISANV